MTVMAAHDCGFKNGLCMTFSESDYLDERIAKRIASDLRLDFVFYSLSNGSYLVDHWRPSLANDSLVFYSGSAHMLAALRSLNTERFGALHAGMLGDALLGTYLADPNQDRVAPTSGMRSKRYLSRINDDLQSLPDEYDTNELFKLYNRGVNGILNGHWTARQFLEPLSPFLEQNFVEYCLRIPRRYRFNERIYINWIRAKHVDAARYRWERTGLNIRHHLRYELGIRALRKARDRILKNRLYSMNPFEHWYRSNGRLRSKLDDSYHAERVLGIQDDTLRQDSLTMLENGSLLEKTQVITLLDGIDLHINGRFPDLLPEHLPSPAAHP